MPPQRHQTKYSMADKQAALNALPSTPTYAEIVVIAKSHHVKIRTLRNWLEKRDDILSYDGTATRTTLGGQGRRETMPFVMDLVAAMKEKRPHEGVSGPEMVEWIHTHQEEWIRTYIHKSSDPEHAFAALLRMCERVAVRHGISKKQQRKTTET